MKEITVRDNFVKRRKHENAPKTLAKGTGGINECFRPSSDASKADLAEFHREDLRLRRAAQIKRQSNSHRPVKKRNDDAEWRNREFHRT